MTAERPSFDAPLTVGAQIEARATHPGHREQGLPAARTTATWTYRQLPRRVRAHGALPARAGSGRSTTRGPATSRCCSRTTSSCSRSTAAARYAGLTLFGVNTGLRGETLAGVLEPVARARAGRRRALPARGRARARRARRTSRPRTSSCCARGRRRDAGDGDDFARAHRRRGRAGRRVARRARASTSTPTTQPHGDLHLGHDRPAEGHQQQPLQALRRSASACRRNLGLGPDDVGYACMPLFHSNAIFLGFHAGLPGRRQPRACASASARAASCPTCSATASPTGTTSASRCTTCSPRSRSSTAATRRASSPRSRNNPKNTLRYAVGNGAAPPDIERFMRWLGLEDMFELYGSTEAAISTFRKKGDPRGSRRRDHRPAREDPERARRGVPAGRARRRRQDPQLRRGGRRDLPRRRRHRPLPGLLRQPGRQHRRSTATASTTRAISATSLERDGKRFLFFDGRTDDWIRKDGENFSAAPGRRACCRSTPTSSLAAAYGVPCAVSDELVMVALKLRAGAALRSAGLLRLLRARR